MSISISKKLIEPTIAEGCRRSYWLFLKAFWPELSTEKPVWNWHIKYLCDQLQNVATRVMTRQPNPYDVIVNISPGTTKSITSTIAFPAWCWIAKINVDGKWYHGRDLKFIAASYSGDLSLEHASMSRDLIKSEKYRHLFPKMQIRADADAKGRYKNNFGGVRHTTSVGGTVMGMHAHIILVDDPINPDGANSEAERRRANFWMTNTLPTRKVDKEVTATFLIMQRLHMDDPTGAWLDNDKKRVRHIRLPGEDTFEISPPELAQNYIDGMMDPVRLGRNVLDTLRGELGAYGYAGQIGQNPIPDAGAFFESDWFIDYQGNHATVGIMPYAAMDFALGDKKENDSNSIKVGGRIPGDGRYLLLDSITFQGEADAFMVADRIIDIHKQWHPLLWGFENGKEWLGIKAYLLRKIKKERLGDFNYILLKPITDKRSRARTLQGQARQGLWMVPKHAPWWGLVESQLVGFGVHAHDDEVDSFAWLARLIEAEDTEAAGDDDYQEDQNDPVEEAACQL